VTSARVVRRLDLEEGERDVARARALVGDALNAPTYDACRDDVVLAVSELVTNALVHGAGQVHLTLSATDIAVRIEVDDRSSARPRVVEAAADATGGRGMRIVEVVSSAWGLTDRSDGGKTVWCEIPVSAR
jgi:anti-sigma regulatory factor (Ser/Thr protein kinase)